MEIHFFSYLWHNFTNFFNMKLNSTLWAASALVLASCGSAPKLETAPLEQLTGVVDVSLSPENLSEEALKTWPHQDLASTGFPGISLQKAYELLKNIKPKQVVVGVIDSGVDINHEDLKDVIWTNPKEIPNNGIDDDKNGYVDDVHGWNFLGDINQDNLEYVRIIQKGDKNAPDYAKALKKWEEEQLSTEQKFDRYSELKGLLEETDEFLVKKTGKNTYTAEDVKSVSFLPDQQKYVEFAQYMIENFGSVSEAKKELEDATKYFKDKLKYHLNKDLNARKLVGDNPYDINDRIYGNNNVIGPDLEGALHGTHVAGIIAAKRHNNIGMDGVANHVAIMAVRAVPDGDEWDKDIALAIRYAVDNGAKVLNTSFGKEFSPNAQWVRDAIKYAASKDVLIVNAAGNDAKDIDTTATYPDDNINTQEYANNMICVGALNYEYNQNLPATFSNYGAKNVDVFAPGVKIYATVPDNKYKFLQGTSMASPEVAGIAALLRAYFPKLTAPEVKEIIMKSGITPNVGKVAVGGDEQDLRPFSELCKSGKIVNAYNAVILAMQKAR